MVTTVAQIKDLLLPGLDAVFGDYDQMPNEWSDMFDAHTSDMQTERDVEVKLLGLAQLRNEGAATAFEDMGERYTYYYKHTGVALGFVMTKFAIRDNLYKTQFGPNTRALKHSLRQTKEVYGASVFNNSNDTTGTYYGGDGVPLLSTAHPIDTGTVANTFTVPAEINETSLQDALISIRRFRDAGGLRVMCKATKICIPPDLMFVMNRLLGGGTMLRVGTSDNDASAVKELGLLPGGVCVNDFLTDVKSWFIKTDVSDGLKFFQRDPLEVDMHTDFTTDNLMTKATERYSFGWSNFRGVFGCMP
jgi:hypothetical protein